MVDLSDTFINAIPDLTLLVRRDGLIMSNLGGREIGVATRPGNLRGKSLAELWPVNIATDLNKLVRRVLKGRTQSDGSFDHDRRRFEVRVHPLGVDRVLMVIRSIVAGDQERGDASLTNALGGADGGDCALFARKLCDAVANARLRGTQVALAIAQFVDLPGIVNAFGPPLGRMLVVSALERIGELTPPAARGQALPFRTAQLETDQLAILIGAATGYELAAKAAEEIRRTLAKPIELDGRTHRLNPVIGLALYPVDGTEPETLLDRARANLLEVNRAGKLHTLATWSKTHEPRTRDFESVSGGDLERELQWAVEREQFSLEYAPVVELNGRRAVSLTASLRWTHSMCGPVAPEQFVPVLEALNVRSRLDAWMLRRGSSDLARISERGNTRVTLAVSLARQFMDSATAVEQITEATSAAGIALSRVDIGIDARTLAGGSRMGTRLRELRKLGVRIFLDNFGQDDIALARLGALPIDGVRVSSELVACLEADASARAACASALAIARSFGFKSMAVGVAKCSELERLYEYGCEQATGPLFGSPKPLGIYRDEFDRQLI